MTVVLPRVQPASTSSIAIIDRFFPANIVVPHHQLRNFISTFYENKIYFVNQFDVYLLDLETDQQTLVATVPFEARCLAAAHGWICVGGETKGDCAFIYIGEEDNKPGHFCHDLLVDMLGRDIVNSVTIHVLRSTLPDKKDETVVLISNNDRSVTIYSLSQRKILNTLLHPNPMNYASISPDGQLLVAVGDENAVYFYKKRTVDSSLLPSDASPYYMVYDWDIIALPSVPMGEEEMDDYSFSVAFSPSGHLCAVSSQAGCITVFDVDVITDCTEPAENAIVCSFRSSRPTVYGCVRSMAFSPEPWDLLAWTEDHGRVGLADVRCEFMRRQKLELKKDLARKVELDDTTPAEWRNLGIKERLTRQHQQRMQALRGHPPVGARPFFPESHSPSADSTISNEPNISFSARERSIIEALETTINEETENAAAPFSIDYTSHPVVRPSASLVDVPRDYEVHLMNAPTRGSSGREPRRRSSVVLSEPHLTRTPQHLTVDDNSRMTMTASPGPMSDDGSLPPMSTNDLTPSNFTSSQPLPYNIPPSDPWHVIEENLRQSSEQRQSAHNSASLSEIEAAIMAERQFSSRLESRIREERRTSILLRHELEQRERLLEIRRRELHLTRGAELVRDLAQDLGGINYASSDLEAQLRSNSQRVDHLMRERDHFRFQTVDGTQRESESTSARSSALPTTSTTRTDLRDTLQQLTDDNRARRLRVAELDSQTDLTRAPPSTTIEEPQQRSQTRLSSDGRPIPPRSVETSPASLWPRTISLDTSRANRRTSRATVPATETQTSMRALPVPAIPPPPRAPRNLATMALPGGPGMMRRALDRAALDQNGNWTSANFRRAMVGRMSANDLMRMAATTRPAGRPNVAEEDIGEVGLGTAGIGWSTDGSSLFIGSESGIFEFKININDRMQMPDLEMR